MHIKILFISLAPNSNSKLCHVQEFFIEDNYDNHKHLFLDKNKVRSVLKDLNNELNILSNNKNLS